MHMGKFSASAWNEVVGWVAFWILADVALAAILLTAVLVTFNRCLGRVDEVHAPDAAPPHGPLAIPPVTEGISECC
jgi:hypothetical protein